MLQKSRVFNDLRAFLLAAGLLFRQAKEPGPMLSVLLATLLAVSQPPVSSPPDADTCLACHGDATMSLTTKDGAAVSLHVDSGKFGQSVHAKLACADCHTGMSEIPHPEHALKSPRDLTVAYSEQCRRCHFSNYSKTLDSAHQGAVARGDKMAPLCVDCHGSHEIKKMAQQPRLAIQETCARCHAGVVNAYAVSVHGRGLTGASAADVPSCNDCHRTHDIGGPHQTQWELRTHELCAKCHADESLMKKYGLSAGVFKTYVGDFHGKTASLRQHQGVDSSNGLVVARCHDCHGVHDIQKADSPSSPVMKANLTRTCARCHDNVNDNFSSAWLSHYEPSLKKAPLVYGVQVAYAVLIPFMIGGLGLQILLHLWRLMVNR
jgi:hypothetical protein